MAIEFTRIHNVVRTYQLAIHLPPSARQDVGQAGHVGGDQISNPLDAPERDSIHLIDEVPAATN
jgi:hypothetical protein